MQITSKGQVTIRIDLGEEAGLTPNTEVDFDYDGHSVRVIPSQRNTRTDRGARIVARLRGVGDGTMTTDEILALTRGD